MADSKKDSKTTAGSVGKTALMVVGGIAVASIVAAIIWAKTHNPEGY